MNNPVQELDSLPDPALDTGVDPRGESKPVWRSALIEILQTVVLAVILYFAIDAVFARVLVLNISMQPTLYEGDVILVNKLAYKFGKLQTGDVVIFHNPAFLEEDYIKRLIGKPGDRVEIHNGKVSVNGIVLDEPYIASPPEYDGDYLVPDDNIFVLGDNRNRSSDSHSWGFVPVEDLVGKALFVYWPFDSITVLSHPDFGLDGVKP